MCLTTDLWQTVLKEKKKQNYQRKKLQINVKKTALNTQTNCDVGQQTLWESWVFPPGASLIVPGLEIMPAHQSMSGQKRPMTSQTFVVFS
jgi:hypothetical protein